MAPSEIRLDPTPSKLIYALRAIGYTFQQAVADLVDNSINARARGVAIRAVTNTKGISRVMILDDGEGMTRSELDESMRLGSDVHRAVDSLGKYGMGLKLASLSQAQKMTVISRSKSHCGGRRWTIDGISRGWQCEVLEEEEVLRELDNQLDSLDLSKCGTIVIWEELDKIKSSKNGVERTVILLFNHLKQHLGLHFHRFIEDERLTIHLEKVEERRPKDYRVERVTALNPFAYGASGDDHYPRSFVLELGGGASLELDAHVWPPNSSESNYRLGGKAAARQGFYFYRNDRLIQAGGWNETRGTEAEPHLSLARVRVDLPKHLDEMFGLSVQKASITVPPSFSIGLDKALAGDGTKFSEFVKRAQQVYRSGERKNVANHPVVPNAGLKKGLRRELQQILAGGNGHTRKVDFVWESLPHNMVFALKRDERVISLNSHYRRRLLQGQAASSGDAPLLKALLFMMNRDLLFSERFSSQQREQVDSLNKVLLAVVDSIDEG